MTRLLRKLRQLVCTVRGHDGRPPRRVELPLGVTGFICRRCGAWR